MRQAESWRIFINPLFAEKIKSKAHLQASFFTIRIAIQAACSELLIKRSRVYGCSRCGAPVASVASVAAKNSQQSCPLFVLAANPLHRRLSLRQSAPATGPGR